MSLRRFVSMMRLVDEQFYEFFVQILNNKKQLPLDDIVVTLPAILLDSSAETMVSNLKIIKRKLSALISQQFLASLELLLRKQKLPQDNKLRCILKLYNIVSILRSEYFINGRYTYTVYQMAVNKYRQDLEDFKLIGQKKQD